MTPSPARGEAAEILAGLHSMGMDILKRRYNGSPDSDSSGATQPSTAKRRISEQHILFKTVNVTSKLGNQSTFVGSVRSNIPLNQPPIHRIAQQERAT